MINKILKLLLYFNCNYYNDFYYCEKNNFVNKCESCVIFAPGMIYNCYNCVEHNNTNNNSSSIN